MPTIVDVPKTATDDSAASADRTDSGAAGRRPGSAEAASRRREPRAALRYGLPIGAAALLTAGSLTAMVLTAGDGAVSVAVPQPPAGAVRDSIETMCRALSARLPSDVLGAKARTTSPESDLTAAWGDPAVVLRCGVPKPVSLRPDNPNYDPGQNVAGVNGVDWTFTFLGEGKGTRFTTLYREVNVEVTVPASYGQPTGPLTAFADAVKAAVPATMGDGS